MIARIPARFMATDRGFAKARKEGGFPEEHSAFRKQHLKLNVTYLIDVVVPDCRFEIAIPR
ncbi:hypothetical protein HW532_08800 [Kaustia mangrovi]|uniref:Uncharacterized protein n=1 Tax=Kaustia mangrovi TaxID=2593653 RepID=A0A7S8C8C9_9HYPH|nr:hypothetical protein HW532_08800 [Kaustia mangrovi]